MPSEPVCCRVLGQVAAARLGEVRWGTVDRCPERLHHQPPVGLLVVARSHLPDLALQAEQRARKRQGRSPLAGPGLRRQLPDPGLGVVVGLGYRRVGLVAAGGADPLVLVVDPRRRIERPLQAVRPEQRARPPLAVDVEDRSGDVDEPVRRDLLEDEVHREQRGEVVGARRLQGARMQGGRWRARQVGHEVVPGRRHLRFVEDEFVLPNRLIHGTVLPASG